MKTVLFFIESLAGGGAERVLTDLVSHLDKEKYDVTVCTVTDEGIYQPQVEACCRYRSLLHVRDYRAGGVKRLLYWLQLRLIYALPAAWVYRFVFREKYDVEVAFVEGFATKLMAASTNKTSRKIVWVHTDMQKNPYADRCFASATAHEAAYRRYDAIACVSGSVKQAFEEKFFAGTQVCVQYNPVDENLIRSRGSEAADQSVPCRPLLGTVGRLAEQKGFLRLLRCVAQLKTEGFQFALWIIGEGTQRGEMERLIAENGLEDTVTLLGYQENPHKFMAQCDAFVCSSYAEGFSTAATESLLLGKPIFTVDCAGMRELFGAENCGEIVENRDEALCEMLRRVVSGQVDFASYDAALQRRGEVFRLEMRMKEIEELLG